MQGEEDDATLPPESSNVPKTSLSHSTSSATLPPQFSYSSARRRAKDSLVEKDRLHGGGGGGSAASRAKSSSKTRGDAGSRGGGGPEGHGGTEEEAGEADSESDSIESIYKRLSGSHLPESPSDQVSSIIQFAKHLTTYSHTLFVNVPNALLFDFLLLKLFQRYLLLNALCSYTHSYKYVLMPCNPHSPKV